MKGLPEMTPVKSTHLQALGHKGDRLFVRFGSGHVYVYEDVPASVYQAGLSAESPGTWFHSQVKGRYPHRKHDA